AITSPHKGAAQGCGSGRPSKRLCGGRPPALHTTTLRRRHSIPPPARPVGSAVHSERDALHVRTRSAAAAGNQRVEDRSGAWQKGGGVMQCQEVARPAVQYSMTPIVHHSTCVRLSETIPAPSQKSSCSAGSRFHHTVRRIP